MRTSEPQFDESVKKALGKWPNVPNCFGWISLNRRGHWLIKNEQITHQRAIEFLGRNYANDEHGRWFIQNGPQRVFCELEYTPLIYSLNPDHTLMSHTGMASGNVSELIVDDNGNLLIHAELGVGLLNDRDLTRFAESVSTASASEHPDWFDFNYIKRKNALCEEVKIAFADNSFTLSAAFKKDLEKKYRFTSVPEPLDSDA